MMDFSKMKMTHKQIGDKIYKVRVGNDIIEVEIYFDWYGYFRVSTLNHYILNPDNKPTNHYRTRVLQSYVAEYLENIYKNELREDLQEIASFPAYNCLKEEFNGHWIHLGKGTTANQVIKKFEEANNACVICPLDTYEIYKELSQNKEGFLSEELRNLLAF